MRLVLNYKYLADQDRSFVDGDSYTVLKNKVCTIKLYYV